MMQKFSINQLNEHHTVEVGFFEYGDGKGNLILRVKPEAWDQRTPHHEEHFFPIEDNKPNQCIDHQSTEDRFIALPFQTCYLTRDKQCVCIDIEKAKTKKDELQRKQRYKQEHEENHPFDNFFFEDVLDDYNNDPQKDERTTRQRFLINLGVFFTWMFSIGAFLAAVACMFMLFAGFCAIFQVTLPFMVGIIVSIPFGIITGVVNHRMYKCVIPQVLLDIFGGIKPGVLSWSKYFSQQDNGQQMSTTKKGLLVIAGLFTLVGAVGASSLVVFLLYNFFGILGFSFAPAMAMAVTLGVLQSFAAYLFYLKYAQLVIADSQIGTPWQRIKKLYYDTMFDIKKHLRKRLDKKLAAENITLSETAFEAKINTQAKFIFACICVLGLIMFSLIVLSAGVGIFVSLQAALSSIFATAALGGLATIAVKAVMYSLMTMIFIAEMIFLLKNAFMASAELITTLCEKLAGDASSQFHGSDAGFLVLRIVNALMQGLIGITPILIAFAAGTHIAPAMLALSSLAILGKLLSSYSVGSSGQGERHVAKHSLHYDTGIEPLVPDDKNEQEKQTILVNFTKKQEVVLTLKSKVASETGSRDGATGMKSNPLML